MVHLAFLTPTFAFLMGNGRSSTSSYLPATTTSTTGINPTTPASRRKPSLRPFTALSSHACVVSPYSPRNATIPTPSGPTTTLIATTTSDNGSTEESSYDEEESRLDDPFLPSDDDNNDDDDPASSSPRQQFEDLCRLLGVINNNLIRLESMEEDGVRGVYLNQNVKEGDLILKVPLSSCLLDDEPPQWWTQAKLEQQNSDDDDDDDTFSSSFAYNNPSDWAPRLAASLLDLQLKFREKNKKDDDDNNDNSNVEKGQHLWLSYLPNSDHLRASLPVHWSEEILSSARCTALELAVDSAYFGRAEAVGDLMMGLLHHHPLLGAQQQLKEELSNAQLNEMCQNALDVVQTRSCRIEKVPPNDDNNKGLFPQPVRVLAPVFDMINHGSSTASSGSSSSSSKQQGGEGSSSSANAQFLAEDDDYLCVRATKDIEADQEVLIDYGDSAKPAWKCLLSYGFVPQFTLPAEDNDEEEQEGENVAEVFVDGHRYEVGPSTIPFDLVSAACAWGEEEEPHLTPEIALKLARRISDVSFYLLVDDKRKQQQQQQQQQEEQQGGGMDSSSSEASFDADLSEEEDATMEELISLQRAASLRWSQHRILQACAKGLQGWASQ